MPVWIRIAVLFLLSGCSMRQMIYPAPPIEVGDPPPPLEEVVWQTEKGWRLSAWHLAGSAAASDRPAVLFLHGNGENLETMHRVGLFEDLLGLDVAFVAIDYPGYGRSTGRPSEASLIEAGTLALQWLSSTHPERPQVVGGWSLGAAVAIQLAAENSGRVDALIAISPWTSLSEVGAVHFPRWLVGLAIQDRYDSAAVAERVQCRSLVVHGGRDRIIPVRQGRRVAALLRADWLEVPAAGHNDLLAQRVVWQRIGAFLSEVQPPAV